MKLGFSLISIIVLSLITNRALGEDAYFVKRAKIDAIDTCNWSSNANPAILSMTNTNFVSTTFANHYSIDGLNDYAINGSFGSQKLKCGLSGQKIGTSFFKKTSFSIALSKKISEKMSFGIIYQQLFYKTDPDNKLISKFGFGIGNIFVATQHLLIGMDMVCTNRNIDQSDLIYSGKIGLEYTINEQFSPALQIVANTEGNNEFIFGANYSIIRQINIGAGISTNENKIYCGLSYDNRIFTINFAIESHQKLGKSYFVSIHKKFR